MAANRRTRATLLRELDALRTRLEDAEETLRAIRSGEVDALLISGLHGEQIFSLQGAEHPYRVLIEQMSDGAATLTTDGMLLYSNRRLAEMLHCPLEQVMGQAFQRFVAPSAQATFEALLRQAAAESARGEVTLTAADGALIPAHLSVNTLPLGEARVLCLVATDLSQQKRQEAMVASERLARSILDQAAEAMVVCDATGQIIRANQAAHRLCGGNPLRQPFAAVLPLPPPAASEQTAQAPARHLLGPVLRGEVLHGLETTFARPDGSRVSVLISAAPLTDDARDVIGCVVTMIDVTERRRAEVALQQAAERLELLHEIDRAILAAHSSEAIAQAALGQLYTLVACWRVGLSLFDVQAQQGLVVATVGRGVAPFPAGTHVPLAAYGARDLAALQAGQTYIVEDVRTCSPLPDTVQALQGEGLRAYARVPLVWQGQLLGALTLWADGLEGLSPESVAVAREVADLLAVAIQQARLHEQVQRHAAVLEARVAERTAELAEANAELEAFASSVAHDLRAPLRSIHGFAQALADDYGAPLDATGQDFLRRIIRASTRMDTLIQDLLTYSRVSREALPLGPVLLQAAVQSAQAQLSSDLQARGASVRLEGPLSAVLAHAPTLVQVLVNVLANAIKFTDPGVPPVVIVRAERTADRVRLWIEDNGIGIPAEYQERIFQPFERLHGSDTYAGTGLGLAIVRRGVERMGGQVGVVSVPGQGSRFWLALPPADEG